MSLRIIDNKRIDMTDSEYESYQSICETYTQGKDLFRDLFEVDSEGVIVFIKTPKKMFSLEALLFVQNLMVHQHLRRIYSEFSSSVNEMNRMKEEISLILNELKENKVIK